MNVMVANYKYLVRKRQKEVMFFHLIQSNLKIHLSVWASLRNRAGCFLQILNFRNGGAQGQPAAYISLMSFIAKNVFILCAAVSQTHCH